MSKLNVMLTVLLLLALGAMIPTLSTQTASSQQAVQQANKVLVRNANILAGRERLRGKQMMVSGGVMMAYLERTGAAVAGGPAIAAVPGLDRNTMGCSNEYKNLVTGMINVRVNQDCSRRRQAEENVAINPLDSNNVIAGQNDSRIGFNHCGVDFSFNRGKRWGDMIPPFWQFLLLDGHTTDACSDPTGAFDSLGNAYFGGIVFNINFAANAIVVTKSNAGIGGAFYHTPNSLLSFQTYRDNPLGVVANDNVATIFNDKELMAADSNAASPKANNVYMTWTRFNDASGAGVGFNSPIYFSQSTNGGRTWSAGIEISGANAAICTFFSGEANPNACDQDQGSMPFVGPDGNVYVGFGNGNIPGAGVEQVLFVKCPAALDCSLVGSWTAPVKVGDLIETHPVGPDPVTGCPAGRQCLPPNGYRAPFVTTISGSISPTTGRIFVTWGDTRNLAAPCNPLGPAVGALPPCDSDIFMASSDTGGATWSATMNISDMAGDDSSSSQWQVWNATGPDGRLYIAYYDRKYGTCETTGCQDITMAVSVNNGASFSYFRITTSSMPNLVVANNPLQAGFLGDYMMVAADRNGAVVVWADTRGLGGTVEEDVYFARFPGLKAGE